MYIHVCVLDMDVDTCIISFYSLFLTVNLGTFLVAWPILRGWLVITVLFMVHSVMEKHRYYLRDNHGNHIQVFFIDVLILV